MDIVRRLRAAGCVFAEDEAALLHEAAQSPDDLERMVLRRIAGTPLELILGWAEFAGLRILVDPGVFVPRRRTEILVREAVGVARSWAVVLDLCCGTGAVGAAIAARVAGVELYAAELEPAAIVNARRNIEPLGGTVLAGDLFAAVPTELRGRFDLIAVNAPYVPTEAIALMPPEARDYEPPIALDGGSDGLDFHRRVAAEANDWLTPEGTLVIESSERQAPQSAELFVARGFAARITEWEDVDGTAIVVTR